MICTPKTHFSLLFLVKTIVILLLTIPAPILNADGILCQNRDFLSSTPIEGSTGKIIVVDTTAYALVFGYGIRIYDVHDPESPILQGEYATPGYALDFVIQGTHAYVADGYDGKLQVINVSDPTNPTYASSYSIGNGVAGAIAISGTTLCIAKNGASTNSPLRYYLFDVTNPSSPIRRVARESNRIISMKMKENVLYFVTASQYPYPYKLEVNDISNPASPNLVGERDLPRYSAGLAVTDEYAYVATGSDGVYIIDITNPPQLSRVGIVDSDYHGVQLSGSYFFSYGESDIKVFDVNDLSSPEFVRSFNMPKPARGVHVSSGIAYVVNGYGLQIINTSDLSKQPPLILGSINTPEPISITLKESTAFIACGLSGLRVIDASTPSSLSEIGLFDTPGFARKAVVNDDIAYIADSDAGLHIVDISDLSNPTLLSTLTFSGSIIDIAMDGDRLYVADQSSLLHVLDVQKPSIPMILANFETPADPYKLDASDGVVVVATDDYMVYVLNAIDPTNITIERTVQEYDVSDIDFYENEVLIHANSDGTQTVTVLDVQNPSDIHVTAVRQNGIYYWANYGSAQIIGIVDERKSLHKIDPNNIFSSLPLGWGSTQDDSNSRVKGVSLFKDLAFIIDDSGLKVIDLSDCPQCVADLNEDKTLDGVDVNQFLQIYSTNSPSADLNLDGVLNFFDISAFLSAFSAGCP